MNWSGILSDKDNGRHEFFQYLEHCLDFSETQQAQSIREESNSHLQPDAETVKLLLDVTVNGSKLMVTDMNKIFMLVM